MRHVIGFLSIAALAVIAAAVLGVAGFGPMLPADGRGLARADFTLDYRSLLLGTIIGVGISTLGRLNWAEYPRRAIAWFYNNERRLIRCGYAAMLLAVLLFY